MSEKSAFRPCDRDLVEFFKSAGWEKTIFRQVFSWYGRLL